MEECIRPMNQYYRDDHGIIVHVIGYDDDRQRVIFRRPGYDWDCAAPKIIFRAKFRKVKL